MRDAINRRDPCRENNIRYFNSKKHFHMTLCHDCTYPIRDIYYRCYDCNLYWAMPFYDKLKESLEEMAKIEAQLKRDDDDIETEFKRN